MVLLSNTRLMNSTTELKLFVYALAPVFIKVLAPTQLVTVNKTFFYNYEHFGKLINLTINNFIHIMLS
jgi:hypothetical protein